MGHWAATGKITCLSRRKEASSSGRKESPTQYEIRKMPVSGASIFEHGRRDVHEKRHEKRSFGKTFCSASRDPDSIFCGGRKPEGTRSSLKNTI